MGPGALRRCPSLCSLGKEGTVSRAGRVCLVRGCTLLGAPGVSTCRGQGTARRPQDTAPVLPLWRDAGQDPMLWHCCLGAYRVQRHLDRTFLSNTTDHREGTGTGPGSPGSTEARDGSDPAAWPPLSAPVSPPQNLVSSRGGRCLQGQHVHQVRAQHATTQSAGDKGPLPHSCADPRVKHISQRKNHSF